MENHAIPCEILELKHQLSKHPLFPKITTIESLQHFMQGHVFAVWDFMSLLKSMQREITCVEVPWRPSLYSKDTVRFVNEIVLGEESDLDAFGNPLDHFSMYISAMQEVGASTARISEFLSTLDYSLVPDYAQEFVAFNIELARNAPIHLVAGAFLFGREDLIPEMFTSIVKELERTDLKCPQLMHYLNRHIELDGGEHGPMAFKLLHELTQGDESKLNEIYSIAKQSLKLRYKLWDGIEKLIDAAH